MLMSNTSFPHCKNIFFFLLALFFFVPGGVQAFNIGEIAVQGITVTGKSPEEVLEKARKFAMDKALVAMGIVKGAPARDYVEKKIGTDLEKYIIDENQKLIRKKGPIWRAKYTITINSSLLFGLIMKQAGTLIRQQENPKIIIAFFIFSSNHEFDGMGLNEEFLVSEQKRFNSVFKETLESIGFSVIKDDEISSLLGKISEDFSDSPDQNPEFKKKILDKAKSLGAKLVFWGSVDVTGTKLTHRIRHNVTAQLSGDLQDLSYPEQGLTFNDRINQGSDNGWEQALSSLVSAVAEKMLIQKGVVHILNSWERSKRQEGLSIKVCDFRSNRQLYSKIKKFLKKQGEFASEGTNENDFIGNLVSGYSSGVNLEDALFDAFPEEMGKQFHVKSKGNNLSVSFSKETPCQN